MCTPLARQIGRQDITAAPIVAGLNDWLWRYRGLVTSTNWTNEGRDTPGTLAVSAGSPTPLVGLPGASWNSTESYIDAEQSARNTPHLACFAWIRPSLIAGADRYILGKYDTGSALGFRWYIRHTVGQMYAIFPTTGGSGVFTENVTSIQLNQWQLVGLAYDPDSGDGIFFRNGEVTRETNLVPGGGTVQGSAIDMRIGANSLGANPFVGDIALPGCAPQNLLPRIKQYARVQFERERRIFGV